MAQEKVQACIVPRADSQIHKSNIDVLCIYSHSANKLLPRILQNVTIACFNEVKYDEIVKFASKYGNNIVHKICTRP